MKIYSVLIFFLFVTACSTPRTVMKNSETGQIAQCGGSATGSLVGGVIGYHIQKSNDDECVKEYEKQGFKAVSVAKGADAGEGIEAVE